LLRLDSSIDGLLDDGRGVSGFVRLATSALSAKPCSATHSRARVIRHIVPMLVVGRLKLDAASCSLETNALVPMVPGFEYAALLGYCEDPCVRSEEGAV
jgi:hypothetical protein